MMVQNAKIDPEVIATPIEEIGKLNCRLVFVDPVVQAEFYEHRGKKKLFDILLCMIILYSGMMLPNSVIAFCYNRNVYELTYCLLNFSCAFFGCLTLWMVYLENYLLNNKLCGRWITYVQPATVFCINIYTVVLASRALFADCNQFPLFLQQFLVDWHCNYTDTIVPHFAFAILSIYPTAAFVTFSNLRIDLLLLMMVISNICFVIVAVFADENYLIWSTICLTLLNGKICVDLHLSHVTSFLEYKQLQHTLAENKRIQEENRSIELRSMIGNVAHDLKTPLTSFMAGIDTMNQIVEDLKQSGQHSYLPREKLFSAIAMLTDCFQNIRNTNNFMVMTINRCIDYIKASKGVLLKPKYETIHLWETMSLPVDCMKNIQDRIRIDLKPLPKELCAYIITDKQWLQENILCLLSNAVKYSSEGTVTITTSVVKEEKVKEENVVSPHSSMRSMRSFHSHRTALSTQDTIVNTSTYIRIEIADQGIGLTEEAISKLFHPFQQAQQLTGGTGLGLYSLAKRIDALRGQYGVMQRTDGIRGTVFWFAFPYRPDQVTALMESTAEIHDNPSILITPPSQKQLTSNTNSNTTNTTTGTRTTSESVVSIENQVVRLSASSSLKTVMMDDNVEAPFTVLIVDDSLPIIKMITMMLTQQGCQVHTAIHGAIGLNMLEKRWDDVDFEDADTTSTKQRGYDVVLIDLQMPVMDGLEATRRWRKLEAERNRRCATSQQGGSPYHQLIIGMSANSDHETMEEALQAGVDDFMKKPFTLTNFQQMIWQHIHPSESPIRSGDMCPFFLRKPSNLVQPINRTMITTTTTRLASSASSPVL